MTIADTRWKRKPTPRVLTIIITLFVILTIWLVWYNAIIYHGFGEVHWWPKCTLAVGIYCMNQSASPQSIQIDVENGLQEDIVWEKLHFIERSEPTLHVCKLDVSIPIPKDSIRTLKVSGCELSHVEVGSKYKYFVNYTYTLVEQKITVSNLGKFEDIMGE